jgi:hypothetical protein
VSGFVPVTVASVLGLTLGWLSLQRGRDRLSTRARIAVSLLSLGAVDAFILLGHAARTAVDLPAPSLALVIAANGGWVVALVIWSRDWR